MNTQAVNKPKLTLFAFQLRNNLALEHEPVKNADALWDKCEELGQKIHAPSLGFLKRNLKTYEGKIGVFPGHENPSSDFLKLLEECFLEFTAIPDKSKGELIGDILPLQIHDTYAVDISLRYLEKNLDIQELSYLNFQGCLLPSQINASLGQTLLLFVQPVDENLSDIESESFANNCLNAILLPAPEKLLVSIVRKGRFLGSPIFECESNQDNVNENIHILIWVNNYPETTDLEKKGDYYQHLINLLSCRHKILYSYSQARYCNQQARNIFTNLEKKVNGFKKLPTNTNDKLVLLNQWLLETPEAFKYANYIRDLQIHRTTIETNKTNYEYLLGKLKNISLKNCDDLDFWEQFIKHTQDKLIGQINTDLNYLIPGQQLFDQMVATIRGIVEIEQAQIDRQKETADKTRDAKLQNTIEAVGVGIGVGMGVAGIFSQTFPLIIEKKWALPSKEHPFLYPHPFLTSFGVSLILGTFLGWQAWHYFKQCLERKLPPEASSTNTLAVVNSNSTILPPSQNSEFPCMTQNTETQREN